MQHPPQFRCPFPRKWWFEAGWLRQLQQGSTAPPISEASEYSIYHKTALEASEMAACYECLQVFPVAEISEFTDAGETALCPFCGIDAVLPDTAGYPFTQEMLEALHEYWFR